MKIYVRKLIYFSRFCRKCFNSNSRYH